MQRKRSRLDIVCDMLSVIRGRRGEIKPTHLMYRSNLSHGQMQKYLEELLEKQFVAKHKRNDREYILITDGGLNFLRKVEEMRQFKEGFGL
jgi:predicted transcriptional regulator